ncbi:MAG: MFS transporter [Coxiellaceae bacterium]|nr:MFS transporter [Coxiellaceae bacterium]
MRALVIFCASLIFFAWGWANLPVPIIHDLAHAFSVPVSAIRFIISLYILVFSLTQIVWGVLSDHFGRRFIIGLSFTLAIIGSLICSFSDHYSVYVLGQVLMAIGSGACPTLSRSILADKLDNKNFALSMIWLTVFMAISPALAAYLSVRMDDWFGWRGVFFMASMLNVVMLMLVFVWLRETNVQLTRSMHPKHAIKAIRYCLSLRQFRIGIVIFGLVGGIAGGAFYPVAALLIVHDLGFSKHTYSLLILLPALGYLLGAFNARWLIKHHSLHQVLYRGLWLHVAILLLFIVWVSISGLTIWSLMVPSTLVCFATSSMTSAANALGIVALHKHRGTGSALTGMSVSLVSAIYAAILSLFPMVTVWPMVILIAAAIIVSLIVYLFGVRRHVTD